MTQQINPISLMVTASVVSCGLLLGSYYYKKIPEKISIYDTVVSECSNKSFPGIELELQQYGIPDNMKIRCWQGYDPEKQRKYKKKQGKSKEDVRKHKEVVQF